MLIPYLVLCWHDPGDYNLVSCQQSKILSATANHSYMEPNKEELEELARDLEERQKRGVELTRILSEIRDLHALNLLHDIVPLWHEAPEQIDLNLQTHSIDTDIIRDGIDVIRNVNFEILLDHLVKGQSELIREKDLFNNDLLETSISKVVNHWRNGEALIPPTIVLVDPEYPNPLGITFAYNDELHPIDGKHRLNAAYYLGSEQIPIVVLKRQANKIKRILEIL